MRSEAESEYFVRYTIHLLHRFAGGLADDPAALPKKINLWVPGGGNLTADEVAGDSSSGDTKGPVVGQFGPFRCQSNFLPSANADSTKRDNLPRTERKNRGKNGQDASCFAATGLLQVTDGLEGVILCEGFQVSLHAPRNGLRVAVNSLLVRYCSLKYPLLPSTPMMHCGLYAIPYRALPASVPSVNTMASPLPPLQLSCRWVLGH